MNGKDCRRRRRGDVRWLRWDEILIGSVKKRPCIWNFTIPHKERNPISIEEAWDAVAKELEGKFEISVIKKRWRNLRDSYIKTKRKFETLTPSGSAASQKHETASFRFYHQMNFLNTCAGEPIKPSVSYVKNPMTAMTIINTQNSEMLPTFCTTDINDDARGSVSLEDNDSLLSENISGVSSPPTVPSATFLKREKGKRRNMVDLEYKTNLLKAISKSNEPMDAAEGFCIHLMDILRRLPYKNRRRVEYKIMELARQEEEEIGLI